MSAEATVVLNGITYQGTLTPQGVTPPPTFARPPGNTGTGLYVAGGRLNNPDGTEFRYRGVNIAHYDNGCDLASISGYTKANAVRMFLMNGYGWSWSALSQVAAQYVAKKIVPIPVCPCLPGTTTATSGDQNIPDLATCVQGQWIANASLWLPVLNPSGILNLVNEFGPSNSQELAMAYINEILALRTAGFTMPLMIDPGGSGQDELSITNYAAQLLAADPQKNLIFAYHIYGGTTTLGDTVASISAAGVITLQSTAATHPFCPAYNGSTGNTYWGGTKIVLNGQTIPVLQNVGGKPGAWTLQISTNPTGPIVTVPVNPGWTPGMALQDWNHFQQRIPRLAALAAQNIVVAITEFGPGNNWGPSPTIVTPADIIGACEANKLSWCAWAFDDNNQANGTGVDWFNLVTNVLEPYTGPTGSNPLTPYGEVVIPAIAQYATPSTAFA